MDPFLGEIRMFGGSFVPQGWAAANGALLSISQNDALFNLYGTTYGGGAGTGCIGGGACGTVFELTVPASFTGGQAKRNIITKRLGQGVSRIGRL